MAVGRSWVAAALIQVERTVWPSPVVYTGSEVAGRMDLKSILEDIINFIWG